jgi:hypothetical protein
MPVTIGLIAAGAQLVGGAAQSAFSGRGKAEKDFESYAKQSPLYRGNPSIDQYYQEALSRYNESPYQSAQYKTAQNAARRTTATGINGLQNWGSAIGGIGKLAAIENDAMQNAGARAEANSSQRFGQLGNAAQMKTSEDYRKFDINEMTPFQRQLQVKQMKSQAANERFNAGLNMMGGAISNGASIASAYAYANPKNPNANKPPVRFGGDNTEPAYLNPIYNQSGDSGYTPSFTPKPYSAFKPPVVKNWRWKG